MDKASDYESGDSRFESWQDRDFEKCISVEAKIVAGKLDGAILTLHGPYELTVSYTHLTLPMKA